MQRRILLLLALATLPLPASATVFGTDIGFNVGFPETPAPSNLESSDSDLQDDGFSLVAAMAEASSTSFTVGASAYDGVFDTSSPRAYARAASGFSVIGVDPGTLIQGWIDLHGAISVDGGTAGPDGTVDVILQISGPGGAGPLSLLAQYELFSGAGGLFETRLENCREAIGGCETSIFSSPTSWGVGDPFGIDRRQIDFLLPQMPDTVIDVILWVLADNHDGKAVLNDFLATATLNIDPPPGGVVTLDSGLVFATPVPEPAGAHLAGVAMACLGAFAWGRGASTGPGVSHRGREGRTPRRPRP